MQLLVSAASAADARAAVEGGAHIVDAKNPAAGALGPVSVETLRGIVEGVNGARLVTAALGDARTATSIREDARRFTSAGAHLVKVGFAGIHEPADVVALAAAAVQGARDERTDAGVVLVAYVDAQHPACSAMDLLGVASQIGAVGVLLDTADKSGPRLTDLVTPSWLAEWVGRAHQAGLLAAVAGRLRAGDMPAARRAGADIAGVRGAACEGGRNGQVSARHVRDLSVSCRPLVEDQGGSRV
jgi:uncharacterized protein (UPF0264 family)